MKPVYRKPRGPPSSRAESSQRSAPEPEAEDLLVENAAAPPQDDMGLDDDIPAEIPELVREYPTLYAGGVSDPLGPFERLPRAASARCLLLR